MIPTIKLSPRAQAAHDTFEAQHKLCRDWLLTVMGASPKRTRTKEDLRAEAIASFHVSKSAFDFGWMTAVDDSGNTHWYDPLPRRGRRRS